MRSTASAVDRRPLAGRTIVVCRAEADAGPTLDRLHSLGASTIALPLHRRDAPVDGGSALAAAVEDLDRFAWVATTSANGARALIEALGIDHPAVRLAAVGPATAAVLEAAGFSVDLVAQRSTAADLAAAFPPAAPGERVLVPLNEAADDALVDGLTAKGYTVDRVDAYRMVRVEPAVPVDLERADAVVFTAPSQVDAFVERVDEAAVPRLVACIGPRTAAAAARRGLPGIVQPATYSSADLIDALVASLRTGDAPPASANEPHAPEKRNP